ncbi:MAG: hypothetical protein WCK37_04060 [Candidatus Falkowbacteria bacterium]
MNGKIRVSSHGNGELTITGLSQEEIEKIYGAINFGNSYIKVEDGQLKTVPKFKDLPGPIADKSMLPFWRQASEEEMAQGTLFNNAIFEKEDYRSPSIIIQSLCGYFYTPEKYQLYAKKLESYGFECLRSRRDPNAKFLEFWYLPGLWAAKNQLKEVIDSIQIKEGEKLWKNLDPRKTEAALNFLGTDIKFGTLDVSIQKLAMPIPE